MSSLRFTSRASRRVPTEFETKRPKRLPPLGGERRLGRETIRTDHPVVLELYGMPFGLGSFGAVTTPRLPIVLNEPLLSGPNARDFEDGRQRGQPAPSAKSTFWEGLA